MSENTERRKYQRLGKEFKVDVKKFVYPIRSQKVIKTTCINISPGGLLLRLREHFNVGDKLQLTLHIPGINKFHPSFFKVFESSLNQSVIAVAEVVRVDKRGWDYEIGVKFLDVYDDDWKALYKFLMKELEKK